MEIFFFLNIDGNLRNSNNHMIANFINTYFLGIADKLIAKSASDNIGYWRGGKKNC